MTILNLYNLYYYIYKNVTIYILFYIEKFNLILTNKMLKFMVFFLFFMIAFLQWFLVQQEF